MEAARSNIIAPILHSRVHIWQLLQPELCEQ
jgi:hypothetical protein